jgi:hypothetical protein
MYLHAFIKQMTIQVMNNCRSGKHAPYIREWGVHITRHLEKLNLMVGPQPSINVIVSSVFVRFRKQRRQSTPLAEIYPEP